ncbi:MAG: transglycosylase SLT domain-containing protein [Gammaproteobacteria bacterium]|nr:transglycosylase SLT domain-containing protein [Gammaproteobacteria bacterium]
MWSASRAARAVSPPDAVLNAAWLQAEQSLQRRDLVSLSRQIQGLRGHPLTPYLQLGLLLESIEQTEPAVVQAFIDAHADLPGIGTLRTRLIEEHARRGQWSVLAVMAARSEDAQGESARCLLAEALWRSGRAAQAWPRVAALWPSARSLPASCDPVLEAWKAAGKLSAEHVWQRLLRSVPAGSARLTRYLRGLLAERDRERLDLWLTLRESAPRLGESLARFDLQRALDRAIVEDVLIQAAARSPVDTARVLQDLAGTSGRGGRLPAELLRTVRERIGLSLAAADRREAFDYLQAGQSERGLESRAVLAIRLRDWPRIVETVKMMPRELADQDRWVYWQGRARQALGQPFTSAAFERLATERGYYAFLAADRLQRPYNMAPVTLSVADALLAQVRQRPGFGRTQAWMALDRPARARSEWFYLLGLLTPEQLRAAARLAADQGWHAPAIFAAGRARAWDDLSLRFPLAHGELIRRSARAVGLPVERIYAIIRQESAFMEDARSSAGAMGPMQLMPGTARLVAGKLKLASPDARALMQPDLNITLGSRYLADLEQRYDSHPVLATAAYNAGPGNVARWLPKNETVPSEVWIESIPFGETRGYVQRVLGYQAIYRYLLGAEQVRISSWMKPIAPG